MASRDVELAGTEGPEIADESVAISALIASGDQLVAPPPSHTRGATPRIQVGIEPLADLGDDQRQR